MPPIGESTLPKVAPNASLMFTVPHVISRAMARARGPSWEKIDPFARTVPRWPGRCSASSWNR